MCRRLCFRPWSGILLFTAVLSAGLCRPAATSAAEAKEDGAEPSAKQFLDELRRACTKQPLRGVLLLEPKAPAVDNGQLRLQGYFDRKAQVTELEKEARKILDRVPNWSKHFPRGVSVEGLNYLPIRTYLKDIQQRFATNTEEALKERLALRETRVDDVYYDAAGGKVRLSFTGVCVYPWAVDKKREYQKLVEQFLKKLIDEVYLIPELKDQVKPDVSAAGIKLWPGRLLQELQELAVAELHLDEVLLQELRYDEDGVLHVQGIVGAKGRISDLTQLLRKKLADDECCVRPADGLTNSSGLRPDLTPVDWGIRTKQLQERLSKEPKELFRQTRLDRAYFAYTEAGARELRFEGVSCHVEMAEQEEVDDKGKLRARGELRDFLEKVCQQLWAPGVREAIRAAGTVRGIQYTPQPGPGLQNELRNFPALDGICLSNTAFFDGEGRLAFQGGWRDSPEQADAFKTFVKQTLKGKAARLLAKAPSLDHMTKVPTREILLGLRNWAAANRDLEDVWLDRLYFDVEGKLHLTGFCSHPRDEDVVKARLAVELKASNYHQAFRQAMGGGTKSTDSVDLDKPDKDKPPRGIAQYLREKVVSPDEPRWDGVLIERGYYDPRGVYVLVGLVDRPSQITALESVLNDLAGKEVWRARLKNKWNLDRVDVRLAGLQETLSNVLEEQGGKEDLQDRLKNNWNVKKQLEVVPLRPMLAALSAVMPDYSELDGLKLERAYHNARKELVFTGIAVGGPPGAAAKDLLKRLLIADPRWKRRAESGVVFQLEERPRSEKAAELAVEKAIDLLTKSLPESPPGHDPRCATPRRNQRAAAALSESVADTCIAYLDTALLHNPKDGIAWYLRAMCLFAKDDRKLAARDLRRMAALEDQDGSPREVFFRRLEPIQGELRSAVTQFADHVTILQAGGHTRLMLTSFR
jgi:hypothetical protein